MFSVIAFLKSLDKCLAYKITRIFEKFMEAPSQLVINDLVIFPCSLKILTLLLLVTQCEIKAIAKIDEAAKTSKIVT